MKIAPSILAADFCHLEDEMQLLEQSNISMLHIDVMDGNFVPNIPLVQIKSICFGNVQSSFLMFI